MARRRRRRTDEVERDVIDPSLSEMLDVNVSFPTPLRMSPLIEDIENLTAVEDRRVFHPMFEDRPAVSVFGPSMIVEEPVQVNVPAQRKGAITTMRRGMMTFDAPRNVAVCIRRKERREVLFALGRRRGGGARKRRWHSNVRC